MEGSFISIADLGRRWQRGMVLKRDTFSTIERGHFVTDEGVAAEAVLRRIDQVPAWARPLSQSFLKREIAALRVSGPLGISPSVLANGSDFVVRTWCAGLPLNLAKPTDRLAWVKSARQALLRLHRAGVAHNDLQKPQNWLVAPDGTARMTDFQLAFVFTRRNKAFRIMAYEDLRHLLNHKRTYTPDVLTRRERAILARKSVPSRVWRATGKRVYRLVTRGILRTQDREGSGPRLTRDAPLLVQRIRAHPLVKDAVVVAYPNPRFGTGLYAFVETEGPAVGPDQLKQALADGHERPPELIQTVALLPRDREGRIRTELLQLIALNQMDLIAPLIEGEVERQLVETIGSARLNLGDRRAQ